METDDHLPAILLTVDEVGPDADNVLLATLVSDNGEQLTVPLDLLPDGTRVGDVLRAHFTRDPDERERRRRHIADLQRRLFGTG
jgi:hypothetical protein